MLSNYNFIDNSQNLVSYSTYDASTWSNIFPAGATLTTGITAPDGTDTAVRFSCNNTTNALLRVSFPSFTPNGTDTYTTSFYVRKISGTGNAATDLADGSPSVNYSGQLITNQWIRIITSGVPTATEKNFIDLFTDSNTSLVLDFWGVQIEKNTTATTYTGTKGYPYIGDGNTYSFDDIFIPTNSFYPSGYLWAWGDGADGKLGINSTIDKSTPVQTFFGGTDWKQVSAAASHTAAIKIDGSLWMWGINDAGQLGTNDQTTRFTPVTVFSGGNNWKQVSCGTQFTTAIKNNGTLWSWGSGFVGRLGTNDTITRLTPVTTFAGGTNWKQVSSGAGHVASVKIDGTLWVWGSGSDGRLGTNDTINRSTPVTIFTRLINWKQVSRGGRHAAGIKEDGTLWTWGDGSNVGRLGNNLFDSGVRPFPFTTFAGGTDWKQVSAGYTNTAAVKTDGTLWVWGNGSNLGQNSNTSRLTPVTTFAGGTNWTQVASGTGGMAAIKTDGTLWTWGVGTTGLLGNNSPASNRLTPVTTFAGGTNWKQVSIGERFMAAIKTDGTLWVWGNGTNGRLGTNDTISRATPTTTFAGGTDWKQVDAGYGHVTAIKTDGTLWVWGEQPAGELGTNNTINRSTPVTTFAGGTNWTQVCAGDSHSVALKTDGTLWLWGAAVEGKLGTNDTTTIRSTPVTTFVGGTDWYDTENQLPEELYTMSIGKRSGSSNGTSAIKADGTLWSWGNTSSLGVSEYVTTISNASIPVVLPDSIRWEHASAATFHTAAIRTDGTLWTWGEGASGKLGSNDTVNRSTPITTFIGGNNWKQVSAGANCTASTKNDGTLWTWGNNSNGQLGNNSVINRSTPVTTFAGGTNWKQLSVGYGHCAAIKTDSTLWIWGDNFYGQLGINSTIDKSTPVTTFAGGTDWKQVSFGQRHIAAFSYVDGSVL